MNRSRQNLWGLELLPFAAAAMSLAGCCANYEAGAEKARAASFATSVSRSKFCLNEDVKIVVVFSDGTTWPDPVTVKRGTQIVVWVGEVKALNIKFPKSPFPEAVTCRTQEEGRFCVALLPPTIYFAPPEDKKRNRYSYDVGFGIARASDPNLEVVP